MFLHEGRPWFATVVDASSPKGARKVVTGRRHRPTYLVPVRTGRLHVPCESALERDYVRVVSVEPNVTSVSAQPHTLYLRSGSVAVRYTPDFAVERLVDGGKTSSVTFIEVKPAAFAGQRDPDTDKGLGYRNDAWRIDLATAAYAYLKLDYHVATEEEIREGARLTNALLIARHACVPVPDRIAIRVRTLLSTGAASTVGACLASAAEDGADTSHILALAHRGFVTWDLRQPLGPTSELTWHRAPAPDALGHIREASFAPPQREA